VTTLVGEMAKAAGLNVAVAGNIGLPVLDLLQDDMQYDLWVLELSSFQLELTHSLAPAAATVLNISPDHLDRHHTIEAYTNAKQRIYHQANYAFYNRADPLTVPQLPLTKRSSFGLDTPTAGQWGIMTEKNGEQYLAFGDNLILPANAMRLKGQHNWSNALAACGLAQAVGIPIHCMRDVLQNFSGLSHRSQWVRTFESVDWINDSKGTNIGATISAISGIGGSMQGKIVLIAGGQGKGADFTELRKPVADFVRSIVLIGEDAPKIEQSLHDLVHVLHATSLEEAVLVAKAQAKPGDVVLLSPACASLDMFRDFNHRGEVFTEAVGKL
jgi:UDP-N-acetylmuramoylalanine--D-glutamate ligase